MSVFRLRAPFRLSASAVASVAGDVASVLGANQPPVWSMPATLSIEQGGTFNLRNYVTDQDEDTLAFPLVSGTLPTGVTLANGIFSAAADAALGESGDLTVGANDGHQATPPTATFRLVVEAATPAGDAALPTIYSQTIDLTRVVHLEAWHTTSRYERFQRLLTATPADASSTLSLPFTSTDFSGGGSLRNMSSANYRLLVDGVVVTNTDVPASTKRAFFTLPTGQMSTGWHELDIEGDAGESYPKFFIYVHRAGSPQPATMPVCTGSYDVAHYGRKHMWAYVPTVFKPSPAPLADRECPEFDTALSRTLLFREEVNTTQEGTIHRPNVNKDGIWSTFNMQNYFWQDLVREYPFVPLLDGPRGVGTVVMPTHIQVDRHGGAYCTDPWRVFRVSPEGDVKTRAGYRHASMHSYWNDNAEQATRELVGDWSAIPVERRGFHELWGLAFDIDSLSLNETDPQQQNPSSGEMESPHVSGPRAFVSDSQRNRICLLTFQRDSFDAEPVVTEFITDMQDPWDVVWDAGFLYISERKANRIVKHDATTGAYIETVVERNAALPGNSFIDTVSRMHSYSGTLAERRAQPAITPEGIFLQDGWLYYSSIAQADVRRINLTTKEIQVIGTYTTDSTNSHFAKIAVSDGTFYPRGTIFVWTWTIQQFGFPQVILPDGTNTGVASAGQRPRGGGGTWRTIGYTSAGGVGHGRLYCGSSVEGLVRLSKALTGDVTYNETKFVSGRNEYRSRGLDLIFGDCGYGWAGYDLPWGDHADMDYFFEAHGHTPRVLPAWRKGQAVGEWREITGSALALSPPSVNPGRASGSISGIIDTWSGLSIDTRSNRVWSPANGGHDDTHENGVRYLDLSLDAPVWVEVLPSNSAAEFTIPSNAARYSSGRPASIHSYYSQQFVERRNRAMRFGAPAVATSGNSFPVIEGYDCNAAVGVNGWDAAGTYPSFPTFDTDFPVCKDPATEDVYVFNTNNAVYKWTEATNTVSTVNVGFPPATMTRAASAFDTRRNRIFLLSASNACHTFDPATGTFKAQTLTGAVAASARADQQAMVYEPVLDAFLVRQGPAGGTIYKIDAGTFAVSELATTGSPPAVAAPGSGGPYGRLLRAPKLGGIVYVPAYSQNAWFLRIN